MARRWRIRYKLMLGLATALAILTMLLAGTVNGLWSYYVTMKAIKCKVEELDEAEKLSIAIAELANKDKSQDFLNYVFKLKDPTIGRARDALGTVTGAIDTTLSRELTNDDGGHLKGVLGKLEEKLAELENLCELPKDVIDSVQFGDPQDRFKPYKLAIQNKVEDLQRTYADLHSGIRANLLESIRNSRRHYQITISVLISVSILGLVLMLSTVRFFYAWIFNPVRDLQRGVTRMAEGDFDHRIEIHSGDEMEELAKSYNDMTDRLRALYRDMATQINDRSRQLVRSERLASVGFLAAGVAHEINNPLASIAFCSEALEARLEEFSNGSRQVGHQVGRGGHDLEVFSKYLKMIQEEAFRCKKITERLLEFSRGGENQRDRTDLAALVQSVLEVTQHHPKSHGKEISFEPDGPVQAWVCVEEIKSVVINLVFNALESLEDGGRLLIELHSKDGMAELVFADTGCGMTQEVLDNIFEPFYTRSRSGKGTGLGLTITHRIVSQHGGEIEATSRGVDQGSTFRVRLPLQQAEAAKEETLGHAAA